MNQLMYDLTTCKKVYNFTEAFDISQAVHPTTLQGDAEHLYFTAHVNTTQWAVYKFHFETRTITWRQLVNVSIRVLNKTLQADLLAFVPPSPTLGFNVDGVIAFSWVAGVQALNATTGKTLWTVPSDMPSRPADKSGAAVFGLTETVVMVPNLQGFMLFDIQKQRVLYRTVHQPLVSATPFKTVIDGTQKTILVSVNPTTGAVEGSMYRQ